MKYLILILGLFLSFSSLGAVQYIQPPVKKCSSIKKKKKKRIKISSSNKSKVWLISGTSILLIGGVLLLCAVLLGWSIGTYVVAIIILLAALAFLIVSLFLATKKNI